MLHVSFGSQLHSKRGADVSMLVSSSLQNISLYHWAQRSDHPHSSDLCTCWAAKAG